MDPEDLFSSTDFLNTLDQTCRRRFSDPNLADECYLFVLDKLKQDDGRRIKAFQGRSSLKTYLFTVINAQITEFVRHRFGRRRIPQLIVKLGELAEAVYQLVCWKRHSYQEAYELVSFRGLFSGSFQDFLQKTDPVREAPCRENPRFAEPIDQDHDPVEQIPSDNPGPLEALLERLDMENKRRAARAIQEVSASLKDEDQLLVRLVYASEQKVAQAARVVGLNPPAARKRLKGILGKYKARLLAEGIRMGEGSG